MKGKALKTMNPKRVETDINNFNSQNHSVVIQISNLSFPKALL